MEEEITPMFTAKLWKLFQEFETHDILKTARDQNINKVGGGVRNRIYVVYAFSLITLSILSDFLIIVIFVIVGF